MIKKQKQGTAPTWNKDVRFLKVSSKTTGKPIAFMYLDPYSRPDEKRGGAWMDEVVGRSLACAASSGKDDEKVRLPVAHMVLNSTPPVGDKPSLMTFREVRKFFFPVFYLFFFQESGQRGRGRGGGGGSLFSPFFSFFRDNKKTSKQVETLFHECGHALQHTLTKQDDGLVSGIRNVEWDAVELPSQW